jgi:hypothetical protein
MRIITVKTWHKISVILLLGAFPGTLALLQRVEGVHAARVGVAGDAQARADIEAIVRSKSAELAAIDVNVATTRGELQKYEDRRRAIVTELETLSASIAKIIQDARSHVP